MGQIGRVSALEESIGKKAVRALTAKFPGQRIYVPWAKPDALLRFKENFTPLIGADQCDALIDTFGGLRIMVPAGRTPRDGQIDMDVVVELTAVGKLTAAQIAVILRCDPRTIHNIRAKARAKGLLKPKHRHKHKRKAPR